MTVIKRLVPPSVAKVAKRLSRKVPPTGRSGVVSPEAYPVVPKVPGTRDKMNRPQWQIKARANRQKKSRHTTTKLGERPK